MRTDEPSRSTQATQRQFTTSVPCFGFSEGLTKALPSYKRAIDLDPKNPILASGLGVAYDALGDPSEAERWFKRSLELQPDLGQTHAYLIWLYLHQHRDREAVEHARNAVTRLPQDPWALNAAAIAELMAGELPRAFKLFERVFPIYRGTRGYRDAGAGVETHLAFLRVREGRRGEADALLDESLATDRRAASAGNATGAFLSTRPAFAPCAARRTKRSAGSTRPSKPGGAAGPWALGLRFSIRFEMTRVSGSLSPASTPWFGRCAGARASANPTATCRLALQGSLRESARVGRDTSTVIRECECSPLSSQREESPEGGGASRCGSGARGGRRRAVEAATGRADRRCAEGARSRTARSDGWPARADSNRRPTA